MEPVVSEEGGQGSGRMLGIVIAEFCHVQEAGPVRLLVVAIDPKVLFEYRIQPLRLAICLGMEGCRAVGLDAEEFDEPPPEMGCEDRIAVTDEGIWQTMNPYNFAKEQGRHVRRRHRFCRWNKNSHFCETIHDDKNSVMVVAGRKIRDPVEGDTGPGPRRNWERGQEAEWSMPYHLVAGTRVAAPDIAFHSCSESGPLVVLGDE